MNRDQLIGAALLVGGIGGILLYGWLVFASRWYMLMLKLTGFVAVAGVLGILAWIGYTLATTPPPKPIEEIEKELEEELKKIEEEEKKEEEKEGEKEAQGKEGESQE
ncbi:MAG: transcriptional regulator [Thermoproteota archaeon]|nr:MAG: transcriptional regulator [Candidatus Korarchaeota archaeon]RLG53640.1 MAG: transcriptional regulator [Candidatus Korarchaeota archaeon]